MREKPPGTNETDWTNVKIEPLVRNHKLISAVRYYRILIICFGGELRFCLYYKILLVQSKSGMKTCFLSPKPITLSIDNQQIYQEGICFYMKHTLSLLIEALFEPSRLAQVKKSIDWHLAKVQVIEKIYWTILRELIFIADQKRMNEATCTTYRIGLTV